MCARKKPFHKFQFFWILALVACATFGRAQDFIHLRTGEVLQVQILGITKEAITFRHPNVPADSISALPIVAVVKANYSNGLEQHFILPTPMKTTEGITGAASLRDGLVLDTVRFRNGNIEMGKVIARRRFSIDFAQKIGARAQPLPISSIHSIRYSGQIIEQINPMYSQGNPFFLGTDFDYLAPHYFAFFAGLNLPVGAYAGNSNQSGGAGFALAGISLGLSSYIRIYNGWGICIQAQRSLNPYDNGGQRQELSDNLEAQGFTELGLVQQSDWQQHGIVAGPSYFIQKHRWMGNFNLTVGALFSSTPINQIRGNWLGSPVELAFQRQSRPVPVVMVSMEARYFLNRWIQLLALAQFSGADMALGSTHEWVASGGTVNLPLTQALSSEPSSQSFNQLTLQLGLGITLPWLK
jgi:hypothetical protein